MFLDRVPEQVLPEEVAGSAKGREECKKNDVTYSDSVLGAGSAVSGKVVRPENLH